MARVKRKSLSAAAGSFDLDLTSLIDAVFLLLIFFLTTTVFVKSTQIKVELPEASHYDRLKPEKKLNLRISADGTLELNGKIVSMSALGGWLESEKMRTGSATLIVTADGSTPHGFVIDAMEVAVIVGVEKIDIETTEPAKAQVEL